VQQTLRVKALYDVSSKDVDCCQESFIRQKLISSAEIQSTSILQQFIQFALIGIIGTGTHYVILVGLHEGLGFSAMVGSTAGFLSGSIVNYIFNYRITFQSKKPHIKAFLQFLTVAGVGIHINLSLMIVLTSFLSVHYLVAQSIATGLLLIWHFLGNRLWAFR
jgi:putative flippase GtrA